MSQRLNRRFEKSRILRVLLVCISIVITIAVFEILIRLISPGMDLNYNWCYHPILGWTQVPGNIYEIMFSGRKILVQFNAKGFRDVEHTEKKNPEVKRIVLIGDSFSEAAQVYLNEVYFSLLESKLNRQSNEKWEVINLGVGDFGTAQEWIALNEYGWNYSPDIILHQIFPLNDICNNQIELFELCKSDNDRYRPYFVETNGGLRLTFKPPVRNFMRKHLISYCLTEISLNRFLAPNPVESEKRRQVRLREKKFPKLDPILYTYATDHEQIPQIAKGWTLTEKILQKIISDCRRRHVPYVAVIIPFDASVDKPTWHEFSSTLPPPRLIRDYPDRRLQKFFDENGVPSVPLMDVLEGHSPSSLYAYGHFTVYGHSLTAQAIYEKLDAAGLLK